MHHDVVVKGKFTLLISATYNFKPHQVSLLSNFPKPKFLLFQGLLNRLFSLLGKPFLPAFPYGCPAIYNLLAGFSLKILPPPKVCRKKIRRVELNIWAQIPAPRVRKLCGIGNASEPLHLGLLICKTDNDWMPRARRAVLAQPKCSVSLAGMVLPS